MIVIQIQPDGTQVEKKRCSRCKDILDKDDFFKSGSWCKDCQREVNRKRVRIR